MFIIIIIIISCHRFSFFPGYYYYYYWTSVGFKELKKYQVTCVHQEVPRYVIP
jgi:hypothetical protein